MPDLAGLAAYLADAERLFVLTGAGISAPSGIGTYRNHEGDWQRSDPVQHQDFLKRPDRLRASEVMSSVCYVLRQDGYRSIVVRDALSPGFFVRNGFVFNPAHETFVKQF